MLIALTLLAGLAEAAVTPSPSALPSPGASPAVSASPSSTPLPAPSPSPSGVVSPVAPFSSPFQAKLGADERWTGYAEADPLLAVYSVTRITFPKKNCNAAIAPLAGQTIGSPAGLASWGEYPEKELETIVGCTSFPCKVKLNAAEVAKLAPEPKANRKAKYLALVEARAHESMKTGKRLGYERPEPAADGWAFIRANADFHLEAPTTAGELTGRRLDLAKKMGGYLEVRELLDERTLTTPTRFHRWMQDVYTDHYFDGWSEEIDFFCASEGEGIFTQTAVVEIDLLKNDDFFSKMMKPKLRHGVRENVLRMMRDRETAWFSSK